MEKKAPEKSSSRVKVNFLSDANDPVSEIPIFVTKVKEKTQKKNTTKTKKVRKDG